MDGEHPTIEQVVAVARFRATVSLSPGCFEGIVLEGRNVYGISTGFDEFSKISIGMDKSSDLQENPVLSHCVAIGDSLNEETVRAMMLLRANALFQGFSGIRRTLIEAMIDMLNPGEHPVVPEKGSLGSGGDQAPLSFMALVLPAEGKRSISGNGFRAQRQCIGPAFRPSICLPKKA